MLRGILLSIFLTLTYLGYSQNISGIITDQDDNILTGVSININNEAIGTSSDENGYYSLQVKANRSIILLYSYIGYQSEKIRIPMLKQGQSYELNIKLQAKNTLLGDVTVEDKRNRKESLTRIKTKHVSVLPGNSVGIEAILKTLPGVSSANELSS